MPERIEARRRSGLTPPQNKLYESYPSNDDERDRRFFLSVKNWSRIIIMMIAFAVLTVIVGGRKRDSSLVYPREIQIPVQRQIHKVRVRGEKGRLEISKEIVGLTSIPYICVTLDWWPEDKCDWGVCSWHRSTLSSLDLRQGSSDRQELTRALRALRPALLRVGGSLQDLVTYEVKRDKSAEFNECEPFIRNEADRIGYRGGCLHLWQFDALQDLALDADTSFIFGISGLHGRDRQADISGCAKCSTPPCEPCWTGVWRPEFGARELLKHAFKRAKQNRSALAAISLGNELCGVGGIAAHLPPEALARDFVTLATEIKAIWKNEDQSLFSKLAFPSIIRDRRPMIIGPDCQLPLDAIDTWNTRFLLAGADKALDALTYHLYWLGAGKEGHRMRRYLTDRQIRGQKKYNADDLSTKSDSLTWPLDRAFFARLKAFERVTRSSTSHSKLPLWVSESGGAYGSGAPNLTNTFISAFWYLDELAHMARYSVSLHCRQSLLGGNYALLRRENDHQLLPNPDFLATKLWANLMGSRVLDATILSDSSDTLLDARAYAHCRLAVNQNDLVVLIINSASRRALFIDVPPALTSLPAKRLEFHVSAPTTQMDGRPDIYESRVLLNGRQFSQVDDPLIPISVAAAKPLVINPLSYVFVIFQGAHWPTCALLPLTFNDHAVLWLLLYYCKI